MVKLFIWMFFLVYLMGICVLLSNRVLLTPQFCFVGCFLPQAVFAVQSVDDWNLDFSPATMAVLFGGVAIFMFVAILYSMVRMGNGYKLKSLVYSEEMRPIEVEKWKLVALLIFQLLSLLITLYYMTSYLEGSNIFEKILYFNNVNKFGDIEDKIRFPRWVSWPRLITNNSCYVAGYLLVHSIILKYKQYKSLLVLNIFISLISMLLTGSRMPVVAFGIALVVQCYVIWGKSKRWRKRIRLKTFIIIIVLGVILVFTFQSMGQLVGRASVKKSSDYLTQYLSGQLKTLDVYVRKGDFGCDISNWQTLITLVNDLGRKLGIEKWVYGYDLPFIRLSANARTNVYTTFYAFLHDGGYLAYMIFLVLEACLSQRMLGRAVYREAKSGVNISVIMYSFALYTISLSFFSERFYKEIFGLSMVLRIVAWWLLKVFFEKVKLRNIHRD